MFVNQLPLMHDDVINDCSWQSIYTDEPLPKRNRWSKRRTAHEMKIKLITLPRWMWRSLDCPLDLRRWLWLSLVTETEYDTVIFDALVLNIAMLTDALKSWKQVHWRKHHLHTAPRLMSTVQLITDCVYHWLASMIDHCMHVQVCDTDSLNQCQGEVLRYMHCTHTTAHSTVLSSILTAWLKLGSWLKSLCKKGDWVLTGLTWIAHC